jgi:ATP-dependent Lon protease
VIGERDYNLLELGPKGTGKSHVYAEFSPHGMLISGSEVTAPKLFVNNANGKIGLVGYWDCICFDEFAGKDKRVDKALVDIMKNYMANRSFSRGIEQLTAEASMVFMGNTQKSVAYMLKHSHFFEPLPDKYIDSAFLDRIHAYTPGWEVSPVRHELFTSGYGFVVDYLAEVLKHLRTEDFTGSYKEYFEVVSEVSTRDQTGFEKTFSGLMKILYPDGKATAAEVEEILSFAMESRRRVREHILRIDDTFKRHEFAFRPVGGGGTKVVVTPEELQYPTFAAPPSSPLGTEASGDDGLGNGLDKSPAAEGAPRPESRPPALEPGHLLIPENTRGWSYKRLFAPYLEGARKIEIRDPYIRAFFQVRNLMEFLEMLHELVPDGDEVEVRLTTKADESDGTGAEKQEDMLRQVETAFGGSRIAFSWEMDQSSAFHARSITTDTGWKISVDRGLDLFQRFESGPFSAEQAIQELRMARGAEITYLRP